MYDITEFWVINHAGLPLFCYAPEKKLDPGLVGGFFSAIQNFAKELESKEREYIRNISFGENNYIFRLNEELNLFFVAKSPKKVKVKKINSHLKSLEEMFIEQFRDFVIDFDGNTTRFQSFLELIDKYFEDNFVKLKGMW